MSILTLIAADATQQETEKDTPSGAPTTEGGYPLSIFEQEGYTADALARLKKLVTYNIPITDDVLSKMQLPIPEAEGQKQSEALSGDKASSGKPTKAPKDAPVSPQRRHTEEMMSLSDGHILLDAAEFSHSDGEEAQLPAISPTTYERTFCVCTCACVCLSMLAVALSERRCSWASGR